MGADLISGVIGKHFTKKKKQTESISGDYFQHAVWDTARRDRVSVKKKKKNRNKGKVEKLINTLTERVYPKKNST